MRLEIRSEILASKKHRARGVPLLVNPVDPGTAFIFFSVSAMHDGFRMPRYYRHGMNAAVPPYTQQI